MIVVVEPGVTSCPPADVLAAFTAGELTAHEISALEPHLDRCASCLGLVGCLAQSAMGGVSGPELAPGELVARYQILSRLGRGAFGVVYAAYDPQLDRRVALKLLHHRLAEDEERFLREARAMARVSSPHVVAVHDVGRIESGLFTAMELVDGRTLGEWLAADKPSAREIVAAFVQAGRGLAAAHAAGIIHRDFKPDNVLVHRSGRVAVTDFGLARAASLSQDAGEVAADAPAQALTLDGTLVGTPLFMAPEALRRGVVDARSDVFSFCVALYGALFGAPAFAASTIPELLAAIERGPRPPRDLRIAGHVREAVLSGLHADPDRRPRSMLALVRALERDPRRRWIVAGAAAGVTLALAVTATRVLAHDARTAPDCRMRAASLVEEVWGTGHRSAVRTGIAGSNAPLADESSARVEHALDRYAASWSEAWTAACQAEEARTQPPDMIAGRMACLDRRRDQWSALVATLEHPDAIAIAGASTAGYALPAVDLCADERWLSRFSSPQDDAQVSSAYAQIAKAQVFADLGNTPAGLDALRGPLALAHATGDRALEAEATLVEGDLRRAVDPRAAEVPLHAAAIAASAAGRLDLDARAKVLLVETLAHSQLRLAEAKRAADYAEAAVTRLGDPTLIADYLYARALAEWSAGGAERSLPIERLLLLTDLVVYGPDHPKVAEAMNSVAVSLAEVEQLDAAVPIQRAALALRERLQGPEHPEALNARGNLAYALAELGRIDEAVPMQEAVAAGRSRVLGADYFLLSETWLRLANLDQWELGAGDEALRAARRARAIDEHEFGADSAEGIASLSMLARVLAAQGQIADADVASARALAIADAHLPRTHLLVRGALATRGYALEQAGRCAEARPVLERLAADSATARSGRTELMFGLLALARCEERAGHTADAEALFTRAVRVREQTRGSTSPMVADALIELARFHRIAGHPELAAQLAARAVEVRTHTPGLIAARARFELAQAQVARAPQDAVHNAEAARALLHDRPGLPLTAEIERWLAARAPHAAL